MLRLAVIPLALLVLVAGAVGWSNRGQGPRADFTFVNRGENKTLDIGVMSWMQDIRIAYAMWEGLYTLDPVTLNPIPGSADEIKVSDDKTVYTFHIRNDARWSNGAPLTSEDFVFGWRRNLEQPGEYTYLFDYVKGAKAYRAAYDQWKASFGSGGPGRGGPGPRPAFATVGVVAPDPHTLRVTLEHPVPFFPALCAYIPFFPQYEPCMRAYAQWDPTHTYVASYDQVFTRPPNLVTNGPYFLQEWSFKRRVRLEANPYYWNRRNVRSRIVDQVYAEDALAQYRMYQGGVVDWLADVDGDTAGDLKLKGRTDLKLFPAFGTYFYDFNCKPKLPDGRPNPLADRRVRRALTMAIEKQPIVDTITRSGEPVATTYIPRGVFQGYVSPPGLPFDVSRAKDELAQAGYPNGVGFPRLTLLFNNESQHGQIAQVIRRQWQQNLGIEIDLEGIEMKVFGERLHQHEFAIARASWYGDYDDPSTFTDVLKSTGDNNNPSWKNEKYDALLKQAEFEADANKRLKILSEAENLMLEDAPIAPIFQYVGRYLVRDNVHGIPLDARQMIMMQSVKVDR